MNISKLILLQYNRAIKKISKVLERKIKIGGGGNKTIKGIQQILDVIDKNIIYSGNAHLVNVGSGDVRFGRTFLTTSGRTFLGTWKPYDGSTVTASTLLSGVLAYDSNGNLITGTHTCGSASSPKPYKLTVYNNCSGLKIVKGFKGTNNSLTPIYCEYGENYDIYVALGDIVTFIYFDAIPNSYAINSPLTQIAPGCEVMSHVGNVYSSNIKNGLLTDIVNQWRINDKVSHKTGVQSFLFYYGANNTSITFH